MTPAPAASTKKSMTTPTERRKHAIKLVSDCVLKDRHATHGEAEDNFADIAAILNVVLKRKLKEPLDSLDAAAIGTCIKMGRIANNSRHLDNWIDMPGYGICGAGIILSGLKKRNGAGKKAKRKA
jgi:hypothetical protein